MPKTLKLQKEARIRVISKPLNPAEKISLTEQINLLYSPVELIFIDDATTEESRTAIISPSTDEKIDNIYDLTTQEKLIKDYFPDLPLTTVNAIIELNKHYNIVNPSDTLRNAQYRIGKMTFSNLFSFGENNEFDFSKYKGLLGIFGENAVGKALDLEVDVPTTKGWKTIKDIQVGDFVFGENGKPTKVIAKSPTYNNRKCYEVIFSDGQKVVCDAEHLWTVEDHFSRQKLERTYQTLTTRNIKKTLKWNKKIGNTQVDIHNEWSVDVCKPVQYDNKQLLVHPYVLGCWLGDGTSISSGFTCADQQIIENLIKFGRKINKHNCKDKNTAYLIEGLITELKQLNLNNNKHIPDDYLFSSVEDRKYLLAGLLDTDGYCSPTHGQVEFCNTNKLLAEQVCELVCSLGFKATISEGDATLYGRFISKKYRVSFCPTEEVFLLQRKNNNIKKIQSGKSNKRFIVDIKECKRRSVQCLVVDNPTHLFLITKKFIPTHNSSLAVDILNYTMFNRISKKGVVKNDSIINENKDYCHSELDLHMHGDIYKIKRATHVYLKTGKKVGTPVYQGKTDVDFTITKRDGIVEEKNAEERSDTDNVIRSFFGTPEDFMLTAVAPQWQLLGIVEAGSTERQKLIGRYFDIDLFEQKNKQAKEYYKILKSKINDHNNKQYITRKKELVDEIAVIKEKLKNVKTGHQQTKLNFSNIEIQYNNEYQRLYEKIFQTNKIKNLIESSEKKILFLKEKIDNINNYSCIKNSDCCFLNELASLKTSSDIEQHKLEDFQKNYLQLKKEATDIKTLVDNLEKEKELLRETMDTSTEDTEGLVARLGSLEALLSNIEILEKEYEVLLKEYEIYSYFLEATSKDGITRKIITKNLNIINKEIKKILSSSINFDIELRTNEEGKAIEIYFIHEKSKPRIIELCSGMEKSIAAIALRAALVSVSTLPKSNLFILDEVFNALSPEYMDATTKILEYLKQLFETVVIITHIAELKSIADHVIEIKRDENGYAKIV